MAEFLYAVALFLLGNLAAGLVRILKGPTAADRILVAQLVGTTGIAIALLVGAASGQAAALDVALILALLASLTALAFVRRLWWRLPERELRDQKSPEEPE